MKARSLVVAGAMVLCSGDLLAFRILESRYHVEVGPEKYIDQLVLRCEDGYTVTVPWQSQLAESCGEDLMGNVTLRAATANAGLVDEEQKRAMLAQLGSQYGNLSEKKVEVIPGSSGLSTRSRPSMVAVLKSYESCRKTHKDKTFCVEERDSAIAHLADAKPLDAKPAPAETLVAASLEAPAPAPPQAVTPAPAESVFTARAEVAAPAPTGEPVRGSQAEVRAAVEQKIAVDYTSCMGAKPKFECEQSRSKAISALDGAKPVKPQRQNKRASAAVGPEAAR